MQAVTTCFSALRAESVVSADLGSSKLSAAELLAAGARVALHLAPDDHCDIIVVYVRPIDQGLWSGGLQLRLARQNMLDALEGLPAGSPDRITALGREYVDFALNEPGVFRLKFGGFTDRLDDPKLQEAGEGTFSIVLHEVAQCRGETEITPDVRRRGFMLWSFVHGLSFLLADPKLTKLGGEFKIDDILSDTSVRMLAD